MVLISWARGGEAHRADAAARYQGRSKWGVGGDCGGYPAVYREFIVPKIWQLVVFCTCRILPKGPKFVENFPLRFLYIMRRRSRCVHVHVRVSVWIVSYFTTESQKLSRLYTCVFFNVFVCIYVPNIYIYLYIYIYTYIYIDIDKDIYIYIWIYIYTNIYTYIYIHIRVCACVYVYVYVHILYMYV